MIQTEKELERSLQSLKQEWESKQNQESSSQTNQPQIKFQHGFWCFSSGNIDSHNPCCFNHYAGLPKHPKTGKGAPITPYQAELCSLVEKYHWVWNLKSKKIGITGGALAICAYFAVARYLNGGEIMLVAGNKEQHAISLMERIRPYFTGEYNQYIDSTGRLKEMVIDEGKKHIKLSNLIELNAYPTTGAVVGRPLVRKIYWDEIAYTRDIDDARHYGDLFSNIANIGGDFLATSTYYRLGGIFYDRCQQLQGLSEQPISDTEHKWKFIKYDYMHGLLAGILDKQTVDELQKDPKINFDMLYRCMPTSGDLNPLGALPREEGDAILL